MKSLRNRSFIDAWRNLYRASNPGADRDVWSWDGVEWVRESHVHSGRHYGFRIETHLLSRRSPTDTWLLLVVVERWWRRNRGEVLKSAEWCKVLEGSDKRVLAWFQRQRERLARGEPNG